VKINAKRSGNLPSDFVRSVERFGSGLGTDGGIIIGRTAVAWTKWLANHLLEVLTVKRLSTIEKTTQ